MSATQLFRISPLTAALAIALSAPTSGWAANFEHTKEAHTAKNSDDSETVITVTAPATSPLEVSSSLKTPRQPIPASDGSDYLKTIPGFSQIRNGGTNGDPIFRGMFGSRLRMLIDDSEILGSCGGRMDAPSSYISPENYDVLSLVKGPQTVLWGSGNSAGTIRFERSRPQFEQFGAKGHVSTVIGSNDRWDSNADLSIGNELGYIRLIGNKSRSNDYKDGDGNKVPSRWDKWNTDIALGWTPDENTLLELNAGQGDGNARYATRGMDGSQFKRKSFSVRFEKSNIGEVFDKFESHFYYNYTDHVMDNYSLRTPAHMKKMISEPDRLTMGGRMMGTWIWEDFSLQSGVDMQTNIHRSNTDHKMMQAERMGWQKNARFRDYGIFGELTWDATKQSKVIGGARLDRATAYKYLTQQERKETLPAGFIRFEHNLKNTPVMFYAGVGYTERFPDFWEIFSNKAGDERIFTDIKTEKTTQLDIGTQYDDNQLKGWVSAYVGKVNDFILFNYDNKNPAHNVNATIMGGETGIAYNFNEHWKTDASLAYSWAQNTTNHRPLPQIPPLEARFGLTWKQGDWTSSGLLRLVNSQHRVAINEGNVVGKDFDSSKSFAILSANTTYQVTKNVQASAGVDNIFNKTYSEHLNLAGNQGFGYSGSTAVNEPGRTYWARLNIKF
ncbi:putative outer membrane copper receptor (OprC) [Xenorhabdus poinarii G6]|uniref:Putative outer membrane copper receptor (OprC) n=1 Tax=Xenorhabdus poinarii G6 TaxID=1354304 RepID=A0A068R282_9GAMM|nr:TonB-dependent copper receptor [Xenorhabdus poinarii]CDG21392.1 putative outer membrane copper receptor (OprC) [Xenorhabdus poinarii G6]